MARSDRDRVIIIDRIKYGRFTNEELLEVADLALTQVFKDGLEFPFDLEEHHVRVAHEGVRNALRNVKDATVIPFKRTRR